MSHNIDKIFYINLDYRNDRRKQIEDQLKEYGLYDRSERFSAFRTPNQGILGCTMSHCEVFKIAKERNYKNILILEDDFEFIVSKEDFENQINQFFNCQVEYHVCMISYNLFQSQPTDYPFLLKVNEAQTASGYIVHQSFYDKLIELYERNIPLLRDTGYHWIYANDQCWKELQPNSKWYCFQERCGKQRDGFSDNSNKYESYNC